MLDIITRYADYLANISIFSYPLSLFLGFLSGMAAITCFLPIIPVVTSFVGGRQITRKNLIVIPLFIMVGSIVALAILGIIVSLAGLTLQKYLGNYWQFIIGTICLIVGLFTIGILKLPKIKLPEIKYKGFFAPFFFGLFMGGTLGFGSSCCVPVLPIVLTYAAIEGRPLHGAFILSSFAIGQSIPIFAIGIFSTVLGKLVSRWSFYVQRIAGVLLLAIGFYLIIRRIWL